MFRFDNFKYLKYKLEQKWSEITASKGYSRSSYKGETFLQRLAEFRVLISTHPVLKISISSVCLILIVTMLWLAMPSSDKEKITDTDKAWFYDLNTKKLFTADKMSFPPVNAPSGPLPDGRPAGVLAHVLTFDLTGKDKSQQFIGYLEKLTDKGKQEWQDALANGTLAKMNWAAGRLIKKVEDEKWLKADSPEGIKIRTQAYKPNEKGHTPNYVNPK